MEFPELLTKSGVIIQILNLFGLGLLGLGLLIMYRALDSKNKLLSESLKEIKDAYASVLEMMKKRSEEIDARFEDEKRFRGLYLSLVEDSETHKAKIKDWSSDELTILQKRVANMQTRLSELEEQCQKLTIENGRLKISVAELESKASFLESQNKELSDIPARLAIIK
ncbi:MAG TPA: hypothetical protein VF556_08520 [Pyrinomonadaceae bacterium]|jgi:chromosome segregation ATPase